MIAAADSKPACWNTEGERADGDILHIVAQQTRIGIRNDQADNQDREDVKQQDTPEDPGAPRAECSSPDFQIHRQRCR